jgi:trimeric autotransporter adhesin
MIKHPIKNCFSKKDGMKCHEYLAHLIISLGVVAGSNSFEISPLLAAPTAPNVTINNQATGTFTDGEDSSTGQEAVVSNIVTITVAEVAGILITPFNTPSPISGSVTNFDFQIKNVGNDPTKFFLPTAPSSITGGTAGILQVVSYITTTGTKIDLSTPINITAAVNTGALSDSTLGGNTTLGSIPADAAIIVRVPVTVTAAANSFVVVTLGNTIGSPSAINTPYIASTNDVYTVDNTDGAPGEAAGAPINGDATNHRQEASAGFSTVVLAPPGSIAGTVFEDPNYGGGAGRPLSTPTTVPLQNARVELYNAAGIFQGFVLTNVNGLYKFDSSNISSGIVAGNYRVRVVNNTVASSRPNPNSTTGLLPVQTFRTDASTGTATNVTDKVGGEKPREVDAPSNAIANLATLDTSIQEVQSITIVQVGSTAVTGIDFGYNFDTIVNTNNTGQGSLRQFVANSNALSNTGLDQIANPLPALGTTAIDPAPGIETSIFMIPANSLPANGVALISLGISPIGGRLIIKDSFTSIDGRTQTINQGNTNNTVLGNATTPIGVGGNILTGVNGPEVELRTINDIALFTSGQGTYVNSISFTGNASAAIQTTITSTDSRIENIISGTISAAQLQANGGYGKSLQISGSNTLIDHNLLLATNEPIVINAANINNLTNITIANNEITSGKTDGSAVTGACIHISAGANLKSANSTLIQNNYLYNCGWGVLMDGNSTGFNTSILQNTIERNNNAGILINAAEHSHTIKKNIIVNNLGVGILVEQGATGIKITENSIYANADVGIDLSPNPGFYINEGLSANNGIVDDANSAEPYGNNGIDYPVITYSTLVGGKLTVKGFVGNELSSAKFVGANLEFFVADNSPADQDGEVIINDGQTKSHGEGRTYIGSCLTNANSQFNCEFLTAGAVGLTNANNITATATDSSGNTSEFSAEPNDKASLVLAKRITAIKNGETGVVTTFDDFSDDPSTTLDEHPNWNVAATGASYIKGKINGVSAQPGDEVEYTMYYLNAGDNRISQARVCDRLNADLIFQPQFSAATTAAQGIQLVKEAIPSYVPSVSYTNATSYLTNTSTDIDNGFFSSSTTLPTGCNTVSNTTNNLSDNVVVADIASNSNPLNRQERGYIKFKVKIRQ